MDCMFSYSANSTERKFSTLVELLRYRACQQPDQIAYTTLQEGETESGRLTYRELDLQVRAIAGFLQSLKASKKRALLIYQPGLEYVVAFLACLYAGVVAIPAYPPSNQSLSRLQTIATNAEAMLIMTSAKLFGKLRTYADAKLEFIGLQWVITDELTKDLATSWHEPEISSNSLAFLQYTSGSTGIPKGVMVSHGNLLSNSEIIYRCFEHSNSSRGVIWLPPYHDMGLIGGILQPLYGGFPVTLMSPISFLQKPLRWLQAISTLKATTSGGPNFAYDLCVRKINLEQCINLDLSSWDVAFTGAEPIRAETLALFANKFEPYGFRRESFYPCYGMAETTLLVTGGVKATLPIVQRVQSVPLEENRVVAVSTVDEQDVRRIVGCGQICPGFKIAVVNTETLTCCSTSEVGEIWVSGPSVALGYWRLVEETKKTFHAYLADTGEGPFLRTGDLGFVQDGELFITGRIKDIIIIRGKNHYPQDIEQTVEKSNPALCPGSGAAFSVDIGGEERLVVVQELERSHLRTLNSEEIVNSIRKEVVVQHGLEIFSIVLVKTGSLPKTSSNKIQRYACRNAFLSNTLNNVVCNWSINPQWTTKFMQLQSDTLVLLQKVEAANQKQI